MNLFLLIGICLVVLYLLLNFFAKASSKKIAKGIRYIIFTTGILLAIILFLVGRYAFTIPILIFLLYLIFTIPGMSYDGVASLFQKPSILFLSLLLTFNFAFHMKLGMQMIIEDYIHENKNLKLALLLNNIFVSIVIIGCTYSLLTL